MVAARTGLLPVRAEAIPGELKVRPQWVNWRLEKRNHKPTKVPYTPATEQRASCTDLLTWGMFDQALAALRSGGYDGIGFVFSSADPFCGIDLDGCRNPTTAEIEAWAEEIVANLDGYAEASPSGWGEHVIVRGKTPNKRRERIEIYSSERFFTVTGQVL